MSNLKNRVYPILDAWPALSAPVAVHLCPVHNRRTSLRVPLKLMRKCGMKPEQGVSVSVYKNRILIQSGTQRAPNQQEDASRQEFILGYTGLNTKYFRESISIVEGPDYLVLTTRDTALKLRGDAPVIEEQNRPRVQHGCAEVCDSELDPSSVQVIGWKDATLFLSNRLRSARVANVDGHLWGKAGFTGGDSIRFTRYLNATVVERCAPEERHSTLRAERNARHFFGASLVDVQGTDCLRVIATPGRLLITQPGSNIGALCTKELHCPRHVAERAPKQVVEAAPLIPLDPNTVTVLKSRDYAVVNGRVTIKGKLWNVAGFERCQPARVTHYSNAYVVSLCDEPDMDYRVGSAKMKKPYRSIGISKSSLSGVSKVRVISDCGRLVLTTPDSDLGRLCEQQKATPNKTAARGRPAMWSAVARTRVLPPLDPNSLEVLTWKDRPTNMFGHVSIAGRIWSVAGFEYMDPVRAVFHGNALVIEKSEVATMDFRVGSPSSRAPYRTLGLSKFGELGNLDLARVIATRGRLIITSPTSELGRRCRAEQEWPTDTREVTQLVKALAQKGAPQVQPLEEVCSYAVPAGRRLQIQGRWLGKLGFTPGSKLSVTVQDGELRIDLDGDGEYSVTEHSPGTSKLYVQAQSLALLKASKVRVLASTGLLKLLPLFA